MESHEVFDLTNLFFLLLGLLFFYIAFRGRRGSAPIRERVPGAGTLDREASSISWTSIQNIAAVLGIASFIIQILQWAKVI